MRSETMHSSLLGACVAVAVALSCSPLQSDPDPDQGGAGSGGKAGSASGGAGSSGAPSAGTSGKASGGSGGTGTAGSGTSGSGGSGGSAGAPVAGSAGSANGGSASGAAGAGAGVGGGAGASAGSGGSPAGGAGGEPAGGAAGSGGGAGASAGGGGGTGGGSSGKASAGCGKSGRPNGGTVTVQNKRIFNFPESYDGDTPFPLLIGFHAAGNPIDQIQGLTNNSEFAANYVRAFGKSAGNEWVYNTDINDVYAMYDDLLATYCIDEDRIFATGHSSGAQMIVQILTHSDAAQRIRFRAVAPVAASNYGAITRAIPVMYIHGKMDSVRGNDGADVVGRFRTANSCGSTSMPYSGVASCNSSGKSVNPGCVSYEGCMEPTVWCSHDDPQYSNTNHGWPCFATGAMYDFFEAAP